jgi:O-antigen ligase
MRSKLEALERIAWAALLLTLPVTSFPFFPPAIGGEALVRPLSIYPLAALLALVIAPRLLTRPIPRTLLTLAPFTLIAAASSLLSLLRGIEPALGISIEARVLRGLFTLGIGCAYYVTIALLAEDADDLRFSLRWIYAGGMAALAWGTLQAVGVWTRSAELFAFIQKVQAYISIRPLRPERIAGLTYEPHWFAEQIILLILPWSLAAVLNGYSAFRQRRNPLTVEALVLGWSVLLLPFTFSRAGLLNLVIVCSLGVIFFRKVKTGHLGAVIRRRVVEAFVVAAIVALPIYLIGQRNPFFARVWEYWKQPNTSLAGYLSYLGFDARVIYGQAAYNTYLAYPILGVGLGNYAFYFEEMLPYRPIAEVPEILLMVTPEPGRDRLITSKNFYLRLLAETGIVGAVAYLAFLMANLGCALYLWLSPDPEWRYWGAASLLGLLAFSLSALTFDSFVIPNTWVVFGLITAAARVHRHARRERATPSPSTTYEQTLATSRRMVSDLS